MFDYGETETLVGIYSRDYLQSHPELNRYRHVSVLTDHLDPNRTYYIELIRSDVCYFYHDVKYLVKSLYIHSITLVPEASGNVNASYVSLELNQPPSPIGLYTHDQIRYRYKQEEKERVRMYSRILSLYPSLTAMVLSYQ